MRKILLIIYLCIAAHSAFAGPGTWPKAGKIFVSKPSLFFKGGQVSIITNDSDDPTSVAKSGDEGSMYIQNGTGRIFQKQDTGSTTNWLPLLIGPAGSGTDECIVRWDGTGAPLIQDSVVCITDVGIMTGITQLNVDNLRLDGNTITSQDVNGNIILDPNGSGNIQLPDLTISRAIITDGSNNLVSSVTTSTELGYVNGVTSAIQIQIDSKLSDTLSTGLIFVGGATSVATGVAMSAEATISSSGAVTLDNDSVVAKELARIGSPVFASIQELQNVFHSVGRAAGGSITSGGVGTIDVASGSGYIRASDSETAEILVFDWGAASVTIPDNQFSYIYVEYNAGSPQIIATTSKRIDLNTNLWLGTVTREGARLHISNATEIKVVNHAALMSLRLIETQSFARVSGGTLGETGTRNITISLGTWWEGLTTFTTTAIDTSASDTFDLFYRDGSGGFTEVISQTQYNNTQYDDNSGVLATLANNRYGVSWFYIEQDGDVAVVLGRGNYTLSQAQDADIPGDTPIRLTNHGRLIAKLIVQKNSGTAISIETAFERAFEKNPVTDHASLIGLSLDDHVQYALLAGRAGGQTLIGGTASGDDLTFQTTSDGTKGSYFFSELTTSRVAVIDGAAALVSSGVTTIELNLLSGRTYIPNSAGTADQIAVFDGTNSTAALGAMTDGQMIIGSTAATPVIGTIAAAANQTTVSVGAGVLTIGTVQDIATTSSVQFGDISTNNQGALKLEEGGGGTDVVNIQAPASLAASYTLTMPIDDGTPDQALFTDGAGSLDFRTVTAAASFTLVNEPSSTTLLVTGEDHVIFTGSSNATFTLPTASTNGTTFKIEYGTAASTGLILTITGGGADTINAVSDIVLRSRGDSLIISSDGGTDWAVLANNINVSAQFGINGTQAIASGGTGDLYGLSLTSPNNAVWHDTHSAVNTTSDTYTIPVDGNYTIYLQAALSTSSGSALQVYVRLNGSTATQDLCIGTRSGGASVTYPNLYCEATLSTGDVLRFFAFQNSGGSLNMLGRGWDTWISIARTSGGSPSAL